jgi:hypothetical protein
VYSRAFMSNLSLSALADAGKSSPTATTAATAPRLKLTSASMLDPVILSAQAHLPLHPAPSS